MSDELVAPQSYRTLIVSPRRKLPGRDAKVLPKYIRISILCMIQKFIQRNIITSRILTYPDMYIVNSFDNILLSPLCLSSPT